MWIPVAVFLWWGIGWPLTHDPFIIETSATIFNKQIKNGQMLDMAWTYDVIYDCPRTHELWLVNGATSLLWKFTGTAQGDGEGLRTKHGHVPLPNLEPGTYAIQTRTTGHCTYLYNETIEGTPAYFEIIP